MPEARRTLLMTARELQDEHRHTQGEHLKMVLESEAGWKSVAYDKEERLVSLRAAIADQDTRIAELVEVVRKLRAALIELDNGYYRCHACKRSWWMAGEENHVSGCAIIATLGLASMPEGKSPTLVPPMAVGANSSEISASDDPVNHPKHYTSDPSGVECIDVIEHRTLNIGNAIKYLWRAGLKNDLIEDLSKARWYVDREIKRVTKLRGQK